MNRREFLTRLAALGLVVAMPKGRSFVAVRDVPWQRSDVFACSPAYAVLFKQTYVWQWSMPSSHSGILSVLE